MEETGKFRIAISELQVEARNGLNHSNSEVRSFCRQVSRLISSYLVKLVTFVSVGEIFLFQIEALKKVIQILSKGNILSASLEANGIAGGLCVLTAYNQFINNYDRVIQLDKKFIQEKKVAKAQNEDFNGYAQFSTVLKEAIRLSMPKTKAAWVAWYRTLGSVVGATTVLTELLGPTAGQAIGFGSIIPSQILNTALTIPKSSNVTLIATRDKIEALTLTVLQAGISCTQYFFGLLRLLQFIDREWIGSQVLAYQKYEDYLTMNQEEQWRDIIPKITVGAVFIWYVISTLSFAKDRCYPSWKTHIGNRNQKKNMQQISEIEIQQSCRSKIKKILNKIVSWTGLKVAGVVTTCYFQAMSSSASLPNSILNNFPNSFDQNSDTFYDAMVTIMSIIAFSYGTSLFALLSEGLFDEKGPSSNPMQSPTPFYNPAPPSSPGSPESDSELSPLFNLNSGYNDSHGLFPITPVSNDLKQPLLSPGSESDLFEIPLPPPRNRCVLL
jgi:hypothetical protein